MSCLPSPSNPHLPFLPLYMSASTDWRFPMQLMNWTVVHQSLWFNMFFAFMMTQVEMSRLVEGRKIRGGGCQDVKMSIKPLLLACCGPSQNWAPVNLRGMEFPAYAWSKVHMKAMSTLCHVNQPSVVMWESLFLKSKNKTLRAKPDITLGVLPLVFPSIFFFFLSRWPVGPWFGPLMWWANSCSAGLFQIKTMTWGKRLTNPLPCMTAAIQIGTYYLMGGGESSEAPVTEGPASCLLWLWADHNSVCPH